MNKGEIVYVGVDPGISGAIAAVDSSGKLIDTVDLPVVGTKGPKSINLPELRRVVLEMIGSREAVACIERVSARPGQGVVSMFRFGRAAGLAEGLLAGLGHEVIRVLPRTWAKQFLPYVDGSDNKEKSRIAAAYKFRGFEFPRKKDHNRAEAALIAEYCRRWHQNRLEE